MKRWLWIILCLAILLSLAACSDEQHNGNSPLDSVPNEENGVQAAFPSGSSYGLEYRINPDIFTCTITGIGDCTDAYIAIGEHIDGYRITAIADAAFYGNTQIRGISLGKYVTDVGAYAFFGCANMEVVELNAALTNLGQYAFAGCENLSSLVIPETLRYIGAWAFYDCTGLTAVTITDLSCWLSIHFDGVYANPLQEANSLYLGETLLTKLVLPEDITAVGDWTFAGCVDLTEVVLHPGVTGFGQRAFLECEGLTLIHYPGSVEEWKQLSMGVNWDFQAEECVIVCLDGEVRG